jgi:Family of unknown function (DUF5706)
MLHRLVERWQPRPAQDPPPTGDPLRDGLEFAWRIHDTVSDVSGRLDIKASIVLTVETAAAAALFVAVGSEASGLADLRGFRLLVLTAAAALLLSAIILAALVITPRLHLRWARARRGRDQIIYYGNLRQWEPGELSDHLVNLGAAGQLEVLSRQLVGYSRVVWRKRTLVEYSVALALPAAGLLLLVFYLS